MKIVVLAGGLSTERDVSITSGTQVCKALRERGHEVILLDVFFGYGIEGADVSRIFEEEAQGEMSGGVQTVDPDLEKVKAQRGGNPDCFLGPNVIDICRMADIVYMGLHGADGENGKVQATFDVLGIRYTGSDYLGSAVSMDKGMAKKIFQASNIPTPKGYTVTQDTVIPVPDEIGFPCVVKPCCGGSSVGVSIPKNQEEYQKALQMAFRYEDEIVVEQFIKGREFSVGVIAGKSLPIIEIIPKEGFYDYETKYQAGMAMDECPAKLSQELTNQMQQWAEEVYKELKMEVYGRIDFLLDQDEQMYCLEANTLPGMTPTSLLPQEAMEVGISYGELCELIISEAMKRYEKKNSKTMKGLTLHAVAEAVGGILTGGAGYENIELSSVTIDSRQIKNNSLFIAIKGQRVDGNDYVAGAYAQGALCCMSELAPKDMKHPYIKVASCTQAMKDLAEYYRRISGVHVIGITGSVGKTTTKEIIASVLSQKYCTLKTLGNFNNEIGLPLTLLRLRPEHEVAVIEMGISDFGEMTRLAKVARPDDCVITNIGQCHLENLGTRDGILQAKTELFTYLKPDGHAYLNGDDDKLSTLESDTRIQTPVFFGIENQKGIYACKIESLGLAGIWMEAVTPDGILGVKIPVPGRHMIYNALAATAVGLDMGLSLPQIKAGIESIQPLGGHGNIIKTDQITIMDDCYNANPVSMKAAIDVLADVTDRRVAIIGDMFELGTDEKEMHEDVGRYAAEKGIELILCIGKLAQEYVKGTSQADSESKVLYFASREEAMEQLGHLIQKGDAILVKASHAMGFENIVAKLKDM